MPQSLWDLISSLTRGQTHGPTLGAWSLNHWTTRKVLFTFMFCWFRALWTKWDFNTKNLGTRHETTVISNSTQIELGRRSVLGMEGGFLPQDVTETRGLTALVSITELGANLSRLWVYKTLGKLLSLSLGFFLHKIEITTARLNEISTYLEQPSLAVYVHFLLLPSKTGTFIQREIQPQWSGQDLPFESDSTSSR